MQYVKLNTKTTCQTGMMYISFLLFAYGCINQNSQKENLYATADGLILASLDAAGQTKDRESIQNLIAVADCNSPKGNYITETHTATGGYSYFKQTYSYSPDPFEAVIQNKTDGFQVGDTSHPLPKEAVYTIRGHEFHNIILEVNSRFHDFQKPVVVEIDSTRMYSLKAKDELNHDCSLFFSVKTNLLTAIHFQNPGDEKEIIKTEFSGWKTTGRLQLPYHVRIDQGGKIFTFDYTRISFNSPGFQYRRHP